MLSILSEFFLWVKCFQNWKSLFCQMYGCCWCWKMQSGVLRAADTQDCPFIFICSREGSVSLSHSLLDTFSQKVTSSVLLHAILFCLLVALPIYSPLYCATWNGLQHHGEASQFNLLFGCCVGACCCMFMMYLSCTRGIEPHWLLFRLTASRSSWQSQVVSFYANFVLLVIVMRFGEPATASRVWHSRPLEDQTKPLYRSTFGSVQRDMIF